jgi:hypothetical protein
MHETQGHAEANESKAVFGTPRARQRRLRKQRQKTGEHHDFVQNSCRFDVVVDDG